MKFLFVWVGLLFFSSRSQSQSAKKVGCGSNTKESSKGCVPLSNRDVLASLNWLSQPPPSPTPCKTLTTIQGISVCEDNLTQDCEIWSTISSNRCDEYGSLEFEKYWSTKCRVVLFHFTIFFKGNICSQPPGKYQDYNIEIFRTDMWAAKCFNCLYAFLKPQLDQIVAQNRKVDVFKIQERGDFQEDFDGVQYTVLSDFFLHLPSLSDTVNQIVVTATISPNTMIDTVGREAENAWNMWASRK